MENIFICLGVISVITYLFYKKSTQDEEIDEFEEGTSICSPVKKITAKWKLSTNITDRFWFPTIVGMST